MRKFNILNMGPIGTGKTFALRTLVDAGMELFVQVTEPGIENVLGDLPTNKCHWSYISPAKVGWDTLERAAKDSNSYDMAALQKLSSNRSKYQQFLEVVANCANFKDDRTGQEFGPVDNWGPERVLAVDGLSGLSQMAMDLVVGSKPIRTLPEYGVAQSNLLALIRKFCYDTKCTFVLLAHMAKSPDLINGGLIKTIDTIGSAINTEVLKPFDEVICSIRKGDEFRWSTTETEVDLKTRVLGWSNELKPDYRQFPFHEDIAGAGDQVKVAAE